MKSGISKDNINIICEIIENYKEKINLTLNEIEETFEKTKNNYEGETSKEFFNKVEELKQNKQIIIDNIGSYIEELKKIQTAYEKQDEILGEKVTQNISNLENSWKEGE